MTSYDNALPRKSSRLSLLAMSHLHQNESYNHSQQQQQRPRSVATGVSRKSSMASRNSQLIKKNTGTSCLYTLVEYEQEPGSSASGEGEDGPPSASRWPEWLVPSLLCWLEPGRRHAGLRNRAGATAGYKEDSS